MKHFTKIAFALLAVYGLPANAEAISYAYIGPINYTLVDLDLNDGIAPSITFYNQKSTYQTIADGTFNQDETTGLNIISNTIALPDRTVSTQVGGNSYSDFMSSSSGNAFSLTEPNPSQQSSFSGSSAHYASFTLSGNTQIVFSVDAKAEAYGTGPTVKIDQFGLSEYSSARAGFSAYIFNDPTNGGGGELWAETSNVDYEEPLGMEQVEPARTRVLNQTFNVGITNLLFSSIDGMFASYTSVGGGSVFGPAEVSPVPVPAALPLLASSLLVFGLRRRKSK